MRQRGLTLIELLIAISLMAVLSLLGWRGLDTMLRSKDTTQQYSQYISSVQTSLAQWRWDLNAMQVVGGINDAGLVCGYAITTNGTPDAFIYSDGLMLSGGAQNQPVRGA